MRIIWGIIGIAIGVLIMKYTFWLTNTFGKFDWAEKYLSGGFGGTYFFFKLLGLFVIAISALYMFGIIDNIFGSFGSVFSPPE